MTALNVYIVLKEDFPFFEKIEFNWLSNRFVISITVPDEVEVAMCWQRIQGKYIIMTKRLLNEEEAAEYLSRSVGAMQALRYKRQIAFIKIGRRIQYDIKDLDSFIERGKVPAYGNDLQAR